MDTTCTNSASPVLVILAAGLGSRYGGLKQMAPVDDEGHIIMDFSLYDAYRAGFREAVCIIDPKNEKDFNEHFAKTKHDIKITYAYQTLDKLPAGYPIPEGRIKPWGTGHAIICAKPQINGPFAVINADDFYGPGAYKLVYDFLTTEVGATHHAMIGYQVENTITESGSVARGVCTVADNHLVSIQETMEIVPAPGGAAYPGKDGKHVHLPNGTMVSMNFWGFGHSILGALESRFEAFLTQGIQENPLKCEYLLPSIVGDMLPGGNITVKVIPTVDKWYGVTYAQDMPGVREAIAGLKNLYQ